MEILFVSHKFPPSAGGMEKQSYELITGMAKYCKVHYIVYNGRGSIPAFFLSLQRKIVKKCAEHPGISIIHYNDGLLASFCMWHKKYPHLKRTATFHGLDVVFPSQIYHKHIFPRFNQFSRLIAVSNATAEKVEALKIKKEKLKVIKNGISTDLFTGPREPVAALPLREELCEGRRYLVMMGRPVQRKGFSWFIREVVPLLKGDFRLLIIGPFQPQPSAAEKILALLPRGLSRKIMLFLGWPSDQPALRNMLKASESEKRIVHLGRLPYNQIRSVFAFADAFLMPNICVEGDMEGFGLVCLEASLMGVPVFAADVDGISDAVVHQQNGFLLPSGQPEAWAKRLNRLIENPHGVKRRTSSFARYTAEHYNSENMVRAYFEEFRSIK